MPISTTMIPPSPIRWLRSASLTGVGPEMTVNSRRTHWCVIEIPATEGTAIALVTPRIAVTGKPASRQAIVSSPRLPNTNGSQPLSRNSVAFEGGGNQHLLDFLLRARVVAWCLAEVDVARPWCPVAELV